MARAYLSLGSNLGDRLEQLREAVRMIAEREGVALGRVSSVYETEPVGGIEQGSFYNIVIGVETRLSPRELLELAQSVEAALKRERSVRWGPRTIDVDILLYDDAVVREPDLVIPHPEICNRAFVLVPLAEIASELLLAGDETVVRCAARVADQKVERVGALI